MNLYQKKPGRMSGTDQYNQAVVRDQVLYKFNKKSGSITATSRDGLMVDKEGRIWVVVRYKNNPERVKKAFYIGDSRDIPPLPKNATEKQKAKWKALVERKFGPEFKKLPDLTAIYDAPEPEVRKRETNLISEKLALRNNRLAPPVE